MTESSAKVRHRMAQAARGLLAVAFAGLVWSFSAPPVRTLSEPTAATTEVPSPDEREGFLSTSWDVLAGFSYNTDAHGNVLPPLLLPEDVKRLDRASVALAGFMVPLETKEDKVSHLLLVRNQLLCCFGQSPKLNEWVFVIADPPVDYVTEVPVTLYGTFHAQPETEDGKIVMLYRLEAVDMETP